VTVLTELPPTIERLCLGCGQTFSDIRRSGAPRSFCEDCAPRRDRPAAKKAPAPPLPGLEPFTVAHFQAWSSRLVLKDGAPFVLEDWQGGFVADVFQGYRECWLIVPEGSGKSTLVAAFTLYCLEFRPEANIPIAASARDQAEIIFQQATGFVRRSPALHGRFQCKPGLRQLVYEDVSRAKIFASDAGTGDGIIPWPLEILDELHRHKNLELYRTWAGKLDKEDAQLVVISTAGEPGGEFEDVRESMRQAATETEVDGCFGRYRGPTSVLHEYAVPEDGDVEDLELVKAANPASRVTVETLRAKRSRPSWNLAHWRRLTCNMPTRSESAAITERAWADALAPPALRIPPGEPIWLGLDLGWVRDTTALVPFWMPETSRRVFGPAVILEPPGDGSHLAADVVERALMDVHSHNPLHTVVMDMSRGEHLAQWIEDELGAEVISVSQTNPQAVLDYERFTEALRLGWLFHSGDEGLRRHVLNAVARVLPGGESRFDRPRESRTVAPEMQRRRAIDALVAAAMVHSTAVAAATNADVPIGAYA
jgi:phage terminase large subunit-like protein